MNGTEGSVGLILIGVAMAILVFVLIRNEGRLALSNVAAPNSSWADLPR